MRLAGHATVPAASPACCTERSWAGASASTDPAHVGKLCVMALRYRWLRRCHWKVSRLALVEERDGPFILIELELDEPGPGELLVKLTATSSGCPVVSPRASGAVTVLP